MDTRRASLRAVGPADYDFLYALSTDPSVGTQLRFHGATPNPDEFVGSIWQHVLVQFLVESRLDEGTPAGLVVASSPDFVNGFVYVSAMSAPQWHRSGVVIEGMGLLLEYLFCNWAFRKIYAESLETSFAHLNAGLGKYFHEEGVLRNHAFSNGSFEDLHLLAIYREDMSAVSAMLDRRERSRE